MESYKIENLSFAYPNRKKTALDGICITVNQGEFVTICGKSGCGKTTLLRLLKPSVSPVGKLSGEIYWNGNLLNEVNNWEQISEIGFVMQSPDNQIVTDKVWHELAFGLESLGLSTPEIRTRVSEMASFFGIQDWFHKKVTELSGGQKQLLNLASVMVMQPSVLILDEPTSQLDPIAAGEFLKALEKINRELGTTVILSEHRLEEAFPMSDRVIVMDGGKIIADGNPRDVCRILEEQNHEMQSALPAPMRVYCAVKNDLECPVTVREGRIWLEEYAQKNRIFPEKIPSDNPVKKNDCAIELKDVWFRYEKNLPDIVKGLNIKIYKGEFFAVLGGNGTGKTTMLSLVSGLNAPYRGEVFINGEKIEKIQNPYNGIIGVLPQNPQCLFVKKTVYSDLAEILSEKKMPKSEKEQRIKEVSSLCRISELLECHPYDLSGGEQQRAALAKVLLQAPRILVLDEPTKGLDAAFKKDFADILFDLKANGVTVLMVSHDVEFCAEYADRCSLFFDGSITSSGTPREFFANNSFYTTAASRMARNLLPKAVLADDIIAACGGSVTKKELRQTVKFPHLKDEETNIGEKSKIERMSPVRFFWGIAFAVLFAVNLVVQKYAVTDWGIAAVQVAAILEFSGGLICFLPQKKFGIKNTYEPSGNRRLTKRTLTAALLILLAIPLTVYVGTFYFEDRKYYFISLLIILETLVPFCMVFESRKPKARELVTVSVLCAIAVAGRTAFIMLPEFKPVAAVVIISGVCFGGETGFVVGAVTGFVSNFFFGQGPWTPWQMFSFGIIGFLAGILFKKGLLGKTRSSLCIFGLISVLIIYGGIMNFASMIMAQSNPTFKMFKAYLLAGLPVDLIHAVSTAFFLWFISEPMIDKLERIKVKYGLIE